MLLILFAFRTVLHVSKALSLFDQKTVCPLVSSNETGFFLKKKKQKKKRRRRNCYQGIGSPRAKERATSSSFVAWTRRCFAAISCAYSISTISLRCRVEDDKYARKGAYMR
jgi:hypothetical protein